MTARELPDSSSIHTCSYYCDRPACVKAQRDQMRDAMLAESDAAHLVSEGMVDAACQASIPESIRLSYGYKAGKTVETFMFAAEKGEARLVITTALEAALGARVAELEREKAWRVDNWTRALEQSQERLRVMTEAKDRAERRLAAAQARIDELMLEYCPDEITAEQLETWMGAQVPVSEQPLPPEKPA